MYLIDVHIQIYQQTHWGMKLKFFGMNFEQLMGLNNYHIISQTGPSWIITFLIVTWINKES